MTQFPIQLNFTMTINKAQGQTLNYVRIYLPTNILSKTTFLFFYFLEESHRQLYAALSRAKTTAFF